MDNHPIPQDVTGFQFKLIGNMTIKQFAYLITGVVLAGILWQFPVTILIKFPLCAFFAILGVGLAYFPISGRPMDLMIANYIKAIIRPTQFVYEKIGGQIYFPNKLPLTSIKNIKQYGNSLNPFPKDKLKTYLESKNGMSVSDLTAGSNLQPATPQLEQIGYNNLPKLLNEQETAVLYPHSPAQPAVQTASSLQPKIQQQSTAVKQAGPRFDVTSITDSPNLIAGITKDSRGNALPNILIEVRDKDNDPVRAFKTNEFGRFTSATPLANGEYTIVPEDPRGQNKFKTTTINAVGQVILPIEAVSIDAREELRRSLFSTNTQTN